MQFQMKIFHKKWTERDGSAKEGREHLIVIEHAFLCMLKHAYSDCTYQWSLFVSIIIKGNFLIFQEMTKPDANSLQLLLIRLPNSLSVLILLCISVNQPIYKFFSRLYVFIIFLNNPLLKYVSVLMQQTTVVFYMCVGGINPKNKNESDKYYKGIMIT